MHQLFWKVEYNADNIELDPALMLIIFLQKD